MKHSFGIYKNDLVAGRDSFEEFVVFVEELVSNSEYGLDSVGFMSL